MKIVHIITRLILGGAQENTLYTCEGLHRRGHEVTLITGPGRGPEGQLMERALAGGYRVIEVRSLRRAIHPWSDLRAYWRLKKLLRALDPEIVHTHSAKAGILGRWAADVVRRERVRVCCPAATAFQESRLRQCGRPRIVHTIHGLAFHPYQGEWLNRLYIGIERRAAERTDVLISVADAMTQQALAVGVGQRGQYVRVFSGLETGAFLAGPDEARRRAVRKELGIPSDAVVIAKVARLFDLKGHEYVIEAAKRLAGEYPKAIWLFIGGGKRREQLERQIARARLLDRFRFTGLVPPERIAELLHASDILVHASLREGLARALPQAMLCGKAVVSFDVDGAREVVRGGDTGFLVRPKDVAGLAEALGVLLRDPELRERMGASGRELCRREFDHEVMVDRIEKVYRQEAARLGASEQGLGVGMSEETSP